MNTLSAQDKERIEAAVRAAETRTGAEIAIVVARAADSYATFPLLWASLLALLAGGAVALLRPETSGGLIVAAQAVLFVLAGLLLHLPALRYRVVPPALRQSEAGRLARLQFAALVQERTEGENGLLLFVSLAEHHVEILVDRGIAARVEPAAWQRVVDGFIPLVRAGRATEGLLGAIEACTAVLAGPFPAVAGDRNEIGDRVTEI